MIAQPSGWRRAGFAGRSPAATLADPTMTRMADQPARQLFRGLAVVAATVLSGHLLSEPLGGDGGPPIPPGREFPLEGVVQTATADGLALRRAPPTATPVSYELADRICGLQNGTKFIATEQAYVANGEIWFRVYVTDLVRLGDDSCSSQHPAGWMVARNTNSWLVMILDQGVAVPSQLSTGALLEGQIEQREAESIKPFVDYSLLLLGTLFAVCVIAVIRAGALSPKAWLSGFLVFEFAVLSMVNLVVMGTLMDQLIVVDEPNFMFTLFKVINGTSGGVALLGFLLSIVCLRFISFVKSG